MITGRSQARLDEAIKEIGAPVGSVMSQVMDVTDWDSCAQGFDKIRKRHGIIDHVVAAAGGTQAEKPDLTQTNRSPPKLWHLENDLKGALYSEQEHQTTFGTSTDSLSLKLCTPQRHIYAPHQHKRLQDVYGRLCSLPPQTQRIPTSVPRQATRCPKRR